MDAWLEKYTYSTFSASYQHKNKYNSSNQKIQSKQLLIKVGTIYKNTNSKKIIQLQQYTTYTIYCNCFVLRCVLNLLIILRRLKPLTTPRSFRSLSPRSISRLPSTPFILKSSTCSANSIPFRNSDMSSTESLLAISSRGGLSAGIARGKYKVMSMSHLGYST